MSEILKTSSEKDLIFFAQLKLIVKNFSPRAGQVWIVICNTKLKDLISSKSNERVFQEHQVYNSMSDGQITMWRPDVHTPKADFVNQF